MEFRLLSYNIRDGGQGREHLLAQVILSTKPDLVILQEATDPVVVRELARKSGMSFWIARRGRSLALLSCWPVAHYLWHCAKSLKHPVLEVVMEAFSFKVFGVHLQPYFSKWSEVGRVREIRFLLEVIGDYQALPHLLVGDFNAVAPGDVVVMANLPVWIRLLVWLSGGCIQREALKTLLGLGYIDGFRWFNPDREGFTFPTPTPHVRLDYVFLSPALSKALKKCSVVEAPPIVAQASDHHPLLSVLEV